MPSYPLRHTFFIRYIIEDALEVGIVQAFKLENEQLYVLSLEEHKGNKERWIPANICICRKILNVYAIKEIMDRDAIKLEDLEVIQDFEWKYLEALSEKGELE
jgi:hypothetical protein